MFSENSTVQGHGVSVFGSATIRVVPDIAVIDFAVTKAGRTTREAMLSVSEAAKSVRSHLAALGLKELSASDTDVEERFVRRGADAVPDGHTGRISFSLLLRNAMSTEEVVVSLAEAGANVLKAVDRQTSQLKKIRADARARAMHAAKEKAEQYCHAAQVSLGQVISIEDLNPDVLRYSRSGHNVVENQLDDSAEPATNDPGTILVHAAVRVCYAIKAAGDA